jgi:hypothetical protein
MKKLFLSVAFLGLALLLQAQTNPIDAMFDKYSEREGFTVVSISGRLLGMFANNEETNKDADNVIGRLKSIKILSVEDSTLNKNLNFYSELSKKLDLSVYEELMLVKEGPDITRFLIRQTGNTISELLVVTGGPGGNSLISIKGDLDMKNISNLSKDIGMKDLEGLENLDTKGTKGSKGPK